MTDATTTGPANGPLPASSTWIHRIDIRNIFLKYLNKDIKKIV